MSLQRSMIRLLSIADVITLINVVFGFLAIVMIFSNEIRFSFSFILLALLADGLDGVVARKTRKGELGEYLEAMADMTSLGIAPAVFVYSIYRNVVSWCPFCHSYLVVALIVFLSLGIIRLASFHIMKDEKYFVGLPASASTIIILILAYFKVEFIPILLVILIVSFAMVSNVRFPKLGYRIDAVAAILILLTLIMGKSYYGVAPIFLLIAIIAYGLGGPIYLWKNK